MMNQKQPYIVNRNAESTQVDDLYNVIEALDELHNQATEGNAQDYAQMSNQELVALLRDVIYTAQETINELSNQQSQTKPILRIVEKMEKIS